MKLRILDSALEDLDRGRLFYERQGEGLGLYFLDSLFGEIDSLVLYAGVHRKVFGFHRLIARHFPYGVYYRLEEDGVVVVWRVMDRGGHLHGYGKRFHNGEDASANAGRTSPFQSSATGPAWLRFALAKNSKLARVAALCHAVLMKEAVVRARVKTRLKRDAEAVFEKLGISTTEAIRMFLSQVRLRKGLPFSLSIPQTDDLLLPAEMRQRALDSVHDD